MNIIRGAHCSGCLKRVSPEKVTEYRGKTYCGSNSCMEIIDDRCRARNRRKKGKKKDRGIFNRGIRSELRMRILHRDDNECALCGDNTLEKLQVHHILPVSEGGGNEGVNLITLCGSDHNMVHLDMYKYSNILLNKANRRENEFRKQ
jgi:5-methylcytosine-specific restriction endonuclease McrA